MPPTSDPLATLPQAQQDAIAEALFQALMDDIAAVAEKGRAILAAERAPTQSEPVEATTSVAA